MSSIIFYSTRKSKILRKKFFEKITYSKKWTEWCAGARARKGDTSEILNIFVAVEGVLSQNIKKLKGENFYFRKKISQCRKKLKGGPFGIFQHSFCRKTAKKIEGGTLWEKKNFRKKVSQCRKKLEGGPFGPAGYGMLRGKTGKTFLVQFARPNSAF